MTKYKLKVFVQLAFVAICWHSTKIKGEKDFSSAKKCVFFLIPSSVSWVVTEVEERNELDFRGLLSLVVVFWLHGNIICIRCSQCSHFFVKKFKCIQRQCSILPQLQKYLFCHCVVSFLCLFQINVLSHWHLLALRLQFWLPFREAFIVYYVTFVKDWF